MILFIRSSHSKTVQGSYSLFITPNRYSSSNRIEELRIKLKSKFDFNGELSYLHIGSMFREGRVCCLCEGSLLVELEVANKSETSKLFSVGNWKSQNRSN